MLFSGTIADNIRWGDKDATLGRSEVCMSFGLVQMSLLSRCQMVMILDGTYGTNVSWWSENKDSVSQSTLKQPKILIMDDSTSAVDTKTDRNYPQGNERIYSGNSKIYHCPKNFFSVEDAGSYLVIDGGKIDAIGTSEELLSKTNQIFTVKYIISE